MKAIAFVVLVISSFLPLHAQEALQNGDFSDAITHWHGDGRSPADYASDNPLQSSDPFTSKGLIVPLKQKTWSKVAQDFTGKIASGILSVTFMVSADFSFSSSPDDYANVPAQLGWGWKSFKSPPGNWLVFINDIDGTTGNYYVIKTNAHTSEPQTVRYKVKGLFPLEAQTITLAFPPGSGTIVVLNVSINNS
jgi:hypothetical protein